MPTNWPYSVPSRARHCFKPWEQEWLSEGFIELWAQMLSATLQFGTFKFAPKAKQTNTRSHIICVHVIKISIPSIVWPLNFRKRRGNFVESHPDKSGRTLKEIGRLDAVWLFTPGKELTRKPCTPID